MYIPPLPNYDLRDIMVQCFNADDRRAYIHRLEKVKFGVPIDDAFTHDIPATLLTQRSSKKAGSIRIKLSAKFLHDNGKAKIIEKTSCLSPVDLDKTFFPSKDSGPYSNPEMRYSHGTYRQGITLVLLLKINKQGPVKKDIWRAPGNQSHVRKLINIMQHGRLVNIDNFSVYTAASVVKKFLCKIPFGIFGSENEEKLFDILSLNDADKQCNLFCRIVSTLPVVSQHLLVLLIGTFSCIVENAERYQTRMNPEALGVSVAPSIFHTCIHDRSRKKQKQS
uniref:Rho-GAP domain-containing protein n=1 Tax=Romanomermis culicivorax TaxID=13658 RepID=A0A915HXT5_ROMCU